MYHRPTPQKSEPFFSLLQPNRSPDTSLGLGENIPWCLADIGFSATLFTARPIKNMVAALLANPNLSISFLGLKLSLRQNRKNPTTNELNFRSPKCTVDTTYGANVPKFSRINAWDPYKRLGISPYASEEEIWSSRNFLSQQYTGDEQSVESVEAAFEILLMRSFWERKRTKINLKTRLKKKVEESPSWVKNLLNYFELPATVIILRRLFLFTFMAGWSVANSAESGPAFQVALSLGACIYFLNDKTKSLGRAAIIGFGSLVGGWFCGSCLGPMVPAAILPATWTLELLTSLAVFVFLFLGCTFLK